MRTLVSIVIWNFKEFITQTIESVINQIYENIDFIK